MADDRRKAPAIRVLRAGVGTRLASQQLRFNPVHSLRANRPDTVWKPMSANLFEVTGIQGVPPKGH
jgi:hypothetical protein